MTPPAADVFFDARWIGKHGIGRYAAELSASLPGAWRRLKRGPRPSHPLDPLYLSALMVHSKRYFVSPGFNGPAFRPSRSISVIHDLIHLREKRRAAYYEHVIRPRLHRSPVILAASTVAADSVREWLQVDSAQVTVCGHGISRAFKYSPTACHHTYRPYVLLFGNTRPHKNLPFALGVIRDMMEDEQVDLRIVGPPSRALLSALGRSGIAASRVSLYDDLDDEQLASQYQRAVLVLCLSLDEGFDLPFHEALACGTPVLASDIPAHAQMLRISGLPPVAPDDLSGAAEAGRYLIHTTFSDLDRTRWSDTVRAHHSWTDVAERFVDAVRTITG